ncbi:MULTISPECIES: DUF2092 domain-containing protein [Pseudomonas]|uniref:DUF2092 domain-containing protein n=1 Tax=Pseudomonas TaxID=286 RepID=UPI0028A68C29|nr:DUF2092 domain-containing protein [Pseudomonas qingdaonensis]
MKRSHRLTCLALLALLPALAKAADPLDPRALTALSNMGSYLHRLQAFSLSTRSETDQQLDSGPTVTFTHHTQVLARQPDKLFVSVDQGSAARQFFYDGKQFTLYDGRHGYYSKGTAPATIEQLLGQLSERYAITLPLADLFRWNAQTAKQVGITQATLIGSESLDGQACTHYVFRQPDIDWQLWLREGAQPLPCKLMITRRDDPERPRHSVTFDWDLSTPINPAAFDFTPPAKAVAVPLREPNEGRQP